MFLESKPNWAEGHLRSYFALDFIVYYCVLFAILLHGSVLAVKCDWSHTGRVIVFNFEYMEHEIH
jgi:hypothetical protein